MLLDKLVEKKIRSNTRSYAKLREDLISARMGLTLRSYLRYSIFCSIIFGIMAGIFGALLGAFVMMTGLRIQVYDVFGVLNNFAAVDFRIAALIGAVVLFIIGFVIGYEIIFSLTLSYPAMQKSTRATKINLTLHNAVSYMYAMRRGGAELLTIITSLSENADVYGEIALEFRQVVRDTQYFGHDILSALKTLSFTTPSEKFKVFLDDLVSVAQSGGNISNYLESRVRMYQEDARFEQKQFLSVLQMVAETYVTAFVAGPLFLIVIMVVMGMIGSSSIIQMSIIGYIFLPVCAVIFMLFVDMISIKDDGLDKYTRISQIDEFPDIKKKEPDRDETPLFKLLDDYDKARAVRNFLKHPLEWFIIDANRSFYVTVPIAVLYVIMILIFTPRYVNPETYYAVIDDHIILAFLMVVVPYGLLIEIWRRRVNKIEAETPDFLDRLAGVNRVGLTVAGAINVLVKTNLGVISYEIRRIKRDIDWGANVNDALVRFEKRINTSAIVRTITLITKASEMSGDIGQVLSIASNDAKMTQTLKRERLSEMLIYIIIIYVSFFVFIFVVAVLNINFLSVLDEMAQSAGGGYEMMGSTALGNVSNTAVDTFRRLLYHICAIQAFCSGLIAGVMGEGSIKSGVKHGAILLIIALIVFNVMPM